MEKEKKSYNLVIGIVALIVIILLIAVIGLISYVRDENYRLFRL